MESSFASAVNRKKAKSNIYDDNFKKNVAQPLYSYGQFDCLSVCIIE